MCKSYDNIEILTKYVNAFCKHFTKRCEELGINECPQHCPFQNGDTKMCDDAFIKENPEKIKDILGTIQIPNPFEGFEDPMNTMLAYYNLEILENAIHGKQP